MEKNMTEGNSLKQILCFAFPLLLGNLFQQLYNLADSIIVGKTLGIDALASVGASGSLNFLIIGFCIGLCSGFAIPVAQTFGAKEYSLMRRYVVNAMALAAGISIAFAVVTALFCRQILVLIRTPENILDGCSYPDTALRGTHPPDILFRSARGTEAADPFPVPSPEMRQSSSHP